jgi:hypothetical protein
LRKLVSQVPDLPAAARDSACSRIDALIIEYLADLPGNPHEIAKRDARVTLHVMGLLLEPFDAETAARTQRMVALDTADLHSWFYSALEVHNPYYRELDARLTALGANSDTPSPFRHEVLAMCAAHATAKQHLSALSAAVGESDGRRRAAAMQRAQNAIDLAVRSRQAAFTKAKRIIEGTRHGR